MINSESVFILGDNIESTNEERRRDRKHLLNGEEVPKFDSLEETVNWLENNKVVNPIIYLGVFWHSQLNWEMDSKMVKRIANLNATFCFSGYEVEEDDK